jgi:hypothetical protein
LERAGFARSAKCRVSSDQWKRVLGVVEGDVRDFSAKEFKGVDLLVVSLNRTIPEPKGKVVYA